MTNEEYQAALDQCRVSRRLAYPSVGDQLDAIYKRDHLDDPAQWQAITAQIDAVKDQFPKPVPPVGIDPNG